jgi:hypothetical protein
MKSKFTLLSILFMAGVIRLFAVPMSGTYTVGGTTPSFNTLQVAIDSLQHRGVNGAVTLDIRPGIYNGQINIGIVPGVSATNTVTIESENHDSTSVTLTDTSSLTTGNFVFHVYGADFLILRHLTLYRIGAASNCTVMNFASNSRYFKMYSCIVKNDFTNGTAQEQSLVWFPAGTSADSTLTFDHCIFINGSYALFLHSQSLNSNFVNPVITNCQFQNQSYYGIDFSYCTAPVISNNTFTSISTSFAFTGINIHGGRHNMQMNSNRMIGMQTGYAMYLDSVVCDAGTPGLISNNFIQLVGASSSTGIYYNNTRNVNTYHNSINNTSFGNNASGVTIAYGDSLLNFRNNILVSTNDGVTFYMFNAADTAHINSDYNDLYVTGSVIAYDGLNFDSTLVQWQTASGQDANSVSDDPLFISSTDLHATSAAVNNNGTHVASVTTDIDGDARNGTTPDIGADEFTPMNNNLGAIYFVQPVDLEFGDSAMVVAVAIKNYGQLTQTGFTVKAVITGAVNTTLTQNYPGNLLSNTIDTVYFTTTINTYNGDSIHIVAYTSSGVDQYHLNDTINGSFHLLPVENIGLTKFLLPSSVECADSATTVAIIVRNFGAKPETGFGITADITGLVTTTLNETYTDTLHSLETDTVYFTTTINTYAGGSLDIVAYTSLTLDPEHSNDTISRSFTFLALPNPPTVQSPQSVCDNAVNIIGSADSTDVVVWYDLPAGGNILAVGNTFSPSITTDTTFYVESHSGGGTGGCIRITEVQPEDYPTGAGDYIEITNLSGAGFDASGYTVLAGESMIDINAVNIDSFQLGFFNPGQVIWISDVTGNPLYWGTNITWNNGSQGWVLIIDSNNHPIDFLPFEWDSTSIANMAIYWNGDTIHPGTIWSGPGVPTCVATNITTMSRIGTDDNDMETDWSCDSVTPGLLNQNLSATFSHCGVGFCGSQRLPVQVLLSPGVTPVYLGNDTAIANTDSLLLDAGPGYTSYLWSTGATSQSIYAMQGSYWVSVTGGTNNCSYYDTININTPVLVKNLFSNDEVSLYPNPAGNKLNVQVIPSLLKNSIFRITDIEGRVLQMKQPNALSGLIEFDLSTLSNGLYYLQIISGDKSGVKKFTIAK